jgi:hypothetical protein
MSKLIPELLKHTHSENPHIRVDSCKAFAIMPINLPREAVEVYAATVIRNLNQALDDPKREIRTVAAEAKFGWMKA